MKVKKLGIVSLSKGILGEDFIRHELEIGLKRLQDYGVEIVLMPHALKGLDYLQNHPESRAKDLIDAFEDDSIDMILCAIGGDDTYRLLPYLFEDHQLERVVNQKIFLGFSDTTVNHFMLHKLGIITFYGQSFLSDVCEISSEMLPYTKKYFEELITTGTVKRITPSEVWYEEREDFSEKGVGVSMPSFANQGFELIRGNKTFEGQILGGCLESIFYNFFDNSRYDDTVELCRKYEIFPSLEEWKDKILLLETSEERPEPALFREMICALERYGIFDVVSGVLVGKPQNETYYEDYKKIMLEEISNQKLSLLCNINIGHSTPRCIIPFGIHAKVDAERQTILFE